MLRKYLYYSLGVLIVLLIVVIGLTIYYNSPQKIQAIEQQTKEEQVNSQPVGKYANADSAAENNNESYYLVMDQDKVSIYKGDNKLFYDYADVSIDTMPVEIREQLKYGLYINSLQELYEFLQTYSS